MQCVEFESRLNCLLDDRAWPLNDRVLIEHAQDCAECSELLAAHEILLEAVQALPALPVDDSSRLALAHRITAEVGSGPLLPFPSHPAVELAKPGATVVAKNALGPVTVVAFLFATAAALLIAFSPWFAAQQLPKDPAQRSNILVTTSPLKAHDELNLNNLPPIARVGYEVADGLTPVTSSMVSALRELRKRPLFRNVDEGQRSSYFLPPDDSATIA